MVGWGNHSVRKQYDRNWSYVRNQVCNLFPVTVTLGAKYGTTEIDGKVYFFMEMNVFFIMILYMIEINKKPRKYVDIDWWFKSRSTQRAIVELQRYIRP